MPYKTRTYRPPGLPTPQERKRKHDQGRGSSSQRLYGARWQKARKNYLLRNPLCVKHLAAGMTVTGTVVDHKIPHRGDYELFWDEDNWQTMCKPCHDTKTAKEDGAFGRPSRV